MTFCLRSILELSKLERDIIEIAGMEIWKPADLCSALVRNNIYEFQFKHQHHLEKFLRERPHLFDIKNEHFTVNPNYAKINVHETQQKNESVGLDMFSKDCLELLRNDPYVRNGRLYLKYFHNSFKNHFQRPFLWYDYGYIRRNNVYEMFEAIKNVIEIKFDANGEAILQITDEKQINAQDFEEPSVSQVFEKLKIKMEVLKNTVNHMNETFMDANLISNEDIRKDHLKNVNLKVSNIIDSLEFLKNSVLEIQEQKNEQFRKDEFEKVFVDLAPINEIFVEDCIPEAPSNEIFDENDILDI